MYQDGFFIGIVEQAQKREYTHTSGSINTTKDIFGNKNIEGDIDTTLMISYEFKLQGHSEVFRTNNEYVIQDGDKVILKAIKNRFGIFDVNACKNFTHRWTFGEGGFVDSIFVGIAIFFGVLLLCFILSFIAHLITQKVFGFGNVAESIIATIGGIFGVCGGVFLAIKSGLESYKEDKKFQAMLFPENFNELNNL
ncbi:hypothetical protein [Campylobacter helveticus]|uniref:hypothetical protein n=1 Tax=Campylobacter helveticus TaxID=28898 RepID=UPI00214A714C|nr:hypothetical protein [Campylobacter helveticus]MCR2062889.1 hypothetical protein [Campylobacter helveticus]